jgi:hypothetical protein
MMRRMDRSVVFASVALAAAATVFVVALARAWTVEPVVPADEAAVALTVDGVIADGPPAEPRVPSQAALSSTAIALAVDNDPFQQSRARPEPYRMPADPTPETPFVAPPPPPTPPFRLVGTVALVEGGLAVLQVEDDAPSIVTVGESLRGYRLESVQPTSALMSSDGRTLQLSLADATPASAQAAERGRGGRGQRGNAPGRGNADGRAAQAAAVLDRLRESGAPAQVLEQMMRNLERSLGEVRTDSSVVIFRGRVSRPDTLDVRHPDPN